MMERETPQALSCGVFQFLRSRKGRGDRMVPKLVPLGGPPLARVGRSLSSADRLTGCDTTAGDLATKSASMPGVLPARIRSARLSCRAIGIGRRKGDTLRAYVSRTEPMDGCTPASLQWMPKAIDAQ
jgi:hypothetical protein